MEFKGAKGKWIIDKEESFTYTPCYKYVKQKLYK
jgi:hypothetical protein